MNDHVDFERLVAGHIAAEGATPPSDAFYDELFALAARKRPRPEWLALIKEPPMRTNSHLAVGSPTVRVAAILAATLLLALALAAAGVGASRLLAAAGPIVVAQDGSGHHTTIQEAVAAATDGDEILILPGIYEGPIDIIGKDIVVRGDDREGVIVEFGHGCEPTDPDDFMTPQICPDASQLYDRFWFGDSPYGFLLADTNTEIRGLTLRQMPTTAGSGIVIRGGAPTVDSITYSEANDIYVHGGSEVVISDSDLGDAWVFVEEQSPATVEGNTFFAIVANTDNTTTVGGPSWIRDNTAVGIAFNGEAVVEGNTVIAPEGEPLGNDFYGQGIDVQRASDWIIRDNVITGFSDATGVSIVGGGTGMIDGNTLSDNAIAMSLGTGDHVVEGNTIEGGGTGIVIDGGEPRLSDNTVEGASGLGIAIGPVSRPVLTGNRSCRNGENLRVEVSAQPEIDETNEICEDDANE
jgi:hypothetical protein